MYMNGHKDPNSHTSRFFTEFIREPGPDSKHFLGVSIENLTVVEENVLVTISICKKENMQEK